MQADLEKIGALLLQAKDDIYTVGMLHRAHETIDQALAELEKAEPKEIDYTKPENWIARRTVIRCKSNDAHALFMGNRQAWFFKGFNGNVDDRFSYFNEKVYCFLFNLPDPVDLSEQEPVAG